MPLSGSQFQQLYDALLDAFPERLDLAAMLRLGLGKRLSTIANTNNLKNDVFLLIETAEAEGWTAELLEAAGKANPGNELLQAMARQQAVEERRQKTRRQACEPRLVRIPAGPFLIGAGAAEAEAAIAEGARWVDFEQPQHTIELDAYAIGQYPVTNREYQAFVQESGWKAPPDWDGDQVPESRPSHPVANISLADALAYCAWLNAKTGKDYRLPSEAEWEKAARGGDGRIYPWGDAFGQGNANTHEAWIGAPTAVGQFSPHGDSPYGCADMAGNVWEMTSSLYRAYPYQAGDNQEDLTLADTRVMRGGAFNYLRDSARCAARGWYGPDLRFESIGFRVVLSAEWLEEDS